MTIDATAVNPRDISYALSARTAAGRGVVRATENVSGRIQVLLRLLGYDQDVARGEPIWDVLWRRYGLSVSTQGAPLEEIPATGPLVIVANHPFGVLDALTLSKLLWDRRSDFKVLANAVFAKAPELAPHILPIDFAGGRAAALKNLETRRAARAHLAAGGAVALFPGGAVASSPSGLKRPFDPEWKPFAAKLLTQSDAPVIPLFFPGRNSRLFEAAGHVTPTLRYGLYMHEFWRRIGRPVEVVIGAPVSRSEIDARLASPPALMGYLRAQTYALSPDPGDHVVGDAHGGPPTGRRWP